jgi:hypothetical protein
MLGFSNSQESQESEEFVLEEESKEFTLEELDPVPEEEFYFENSANSQKSSTAREVEKLLAGSLNRLVV